MGCLPAHGISSKALCSMCSKATVSWQKQRHTGNIRESHTHVGPKDKKYPCTVCPNQYAVCQLHMNCPFGKHKRSLRETQDGPMLLFLPKMKIIKWIIKEQKSIIPKHITLIIRLISLLSRPFLRTSLSLEYIVLVPLVS